MFDELDAYRDRDSVFMRGAIDQRLTKACCVSGGVVAFMATPESGITVCVGRDVQIRDDIIIPFPYIDHAGWSNLSSIEEAVVLTETSYSVYDCTTAFNPDVEELSFLDFVVLQGGEVPHNAFHDRFLIQLDTCKSERMTETFKEVPHYRDLEFSKKKRRY